MEKPIVLSAFLGLTPKYLQAFLADTRSSMDSFRNSTTIMFSHFLEKRHFWNTSQKKGRLSFWPQNFWLWTAYDWVILRTTFISTHLPEPWDSLIDLTLPSSSPGHLVSTMDRVFTMVQLWFSGGFLQDTMVALSVLINHALHPRIVLGSKWS